MNARTQVVVKAGSDVGGEVFVLGVLALAARVLSTADFAELALASTLGWILAVITDFGLQVHLAKVVARALAEGNAVITKTTALAATLKKAGVDLTVPAAIK